MKYDYEDTDILNLNFFKVELMPGVIRLLEHLKNCGIPMALATSSSKEYLSLKTSKKHSSVFTPKEQNGMTLGFQHPFYIDMFLCTMIYKHIKESSTSCYSIYVFRKIL